MERELRRMFDMKENEMTVPPTLSPELRKRIGRQRMVMGGLVASAAMALVIGGFAGARSLSTDDAAPVRPADETKEELGIFATVAGRIAYANEGADVGYDRGLWAVDPSGPSDRTEGPSVADDVASTLVRVGPEDAIAVDDERGLHAAPLGWSSDGTKLLLQRTYEKSGFPDQYLYILHADGSETQLNTDPMYFTDATISPDGESVVFGCQGDCAGLWVVDAEGGRPVRLPVPVDGYAPTFSPDGTQIAYLADVNNEEGHVWVADVDGSDAHEILAIEATVFRGPTGLQWSPAGDRLAIGLGASKGSDGLAIYTFAPDGSVFTQVITGGTSPSWSPDGSQIAYTILCSEHNDAACPVGSILRSQYDAQPNHFGGGSAGLAIANADGSNVREFGFAASGPWHPGE